MIDDYPERTEAENIDPQEHIDKDDPRYDGFRIREYWIATATAPDDQEGILMVDVSDAAKYHLSRGVAMASDLRRLQHLRVFCTVVARELGVEVKIRHFIPEGKDEVFAP